MNSILIIAGKESTGEALCRLLAERNYVCSIVQDNEQTINQIAEQVPDLVLLEGNKRTRIQELAGLIKQKNNLPVIALVDKETLVDMDGHLDLIDDFVVEPYDPAEVSLRVERILRRKGKAGSGEVIRCGDLVIDLAKYEVFVNGKPLLLTFKEYELIRVLASNVGRVFSREVLLNKIWGYDYFGGDRTVDVHITRLRSKIEHSRQVIIETVRNVGYRLRIDVEANKAGH